jgi:zinc transporter
MTPEQRPDVASPCTGLAWAFRIPGEGPVHSFEALEDLGRPAPGESGYLWAHLDLNVPAAREWLASRSDLPDDAIEGLLAAETQPRAFATHEGLLLYLRGVNLNPGAEPEDMVGIRLWIEPGRVVSVRLRPLMAARELRDQLAEGRGPRTIGALITTLADGLVERMDPVIKNLTERVDDLEERLYLDRRPTTDSLLPETQRESIIFRRYLSPQREALATLARAPVEWLTEDDREALFDASANVSRLVEELHAIRERAAVVEAEIDRRNSERLNRSTYLLTVIAGVFLPLSLITGLLGINVAGIPLAEVPWAFAAVCALLVILAVAEFALLRWLRWL